MARAQAEAAVKSMNGDVLALDVVKERIPNERAVAEDPDIACGIPVGQYAFERGVEFFLGNQTGY
jgi:hypothetical protein